MPRATTFYFGGIDIIFSDPPYAKFATLYNKILKEANFAEWASSALMIWEQPPDFKDVYNSEGLLWKVTDVRKFAQTQFIFLKQ